MSIILGWIKDHIWILILFLVSILTFIVVYRLKPDGIDPFERAKSEAKAAKEAGKVRKVKAKYGARAAKEFVASTYVDQMDQLDEKQKQQAKDLENDPVALSKFLVRSVN